jgi:hypothetical protein
VKTFGRTQGNRRRREVRGVRRWLVFLVSFSLSLSFQLVKEYIYVLVH